MIDFTSETWTQLASRLGELRANESARLESKDLSLEDTQFSRGKIAAYKELLALPKLLAARSRNDRPE
ncbi:MAG TPA: hypothetical protein VF472_12330 [Burkholderiaceae bacterium]